ncbi:MAG: hypothetical protein WCF85_00700 [Rhodospirillaceae bacterium]
MTSETFILSAFKHLAGVVRCDEVMDKVRSRNGLASWFAELPWDEKMFKVGDGVSPELSPVSGNWLARVSKDGPALILTSTMDPERAEIIVRGRNFWHHLIRALENGQDDASITSRSHVRLETVTHGHSTEESAPVQELALNRWDKRAFQRWTAKSPQRPAVKRRSSGAGTPSAAYSIFYQ